MRKGFAVLIALGIWVLLGWSLLGDVTPIYAQRVTATKPPAPLPTQPPNRPQINFRESDPFLPPVIPLPVVNTPTNTPVTPPPPNTLTNTPTNTSTSTPTRTPTLTPTNTATVTPTPLSSSIVVNEFLPKARSKDWNNDGVENFDDEWIELYNSGLATVDLTGWKLDTGDKTLAFTIPPSTTIASKAFRVFYRSQTKLALDSANTVRLVFPNGNIADTVQFTELDYDRVGARAIDGGNPWRTDCVPSPDASNCLIAATVTSSFAMPYFRDNIANSRDELNLAVVITNILLAIILALAMGFFGNLLNDALESHEEHVAKLLGPITQATNRLRKLGNGFDNWMSASRLAWLGFLIKLAVILVIYGTILAYLDPSFTFVTQDGLLLIIALGLSTGLIGLIDDLASYIVLRLRGGNGVIRMHSGNFLVVVFSTLFSRLSGIVPGLILGNPAGIEQITDPGEGKYIDLLAILSTGIVAFIAWILAPMFRGNAWLNTLLLLIFAAGVQTTFFEMMPISYLHGKGIFRSSRIVWLILFAITAAVFLQTMLNPNGSFVGAFNSPNMVVLSLIVVAYCVFCVGMWFYLQQIDKKSAAE